MTRFAQSWGASLALAATIAACGSSNDDPITIGGGPQATGGSIPIGQGTGGTNVQVGSGGGTSTAGTSPGTGVFDGGQLPITPEQVTSIKGSSCAGMAVEGETLPAVLELVVDVSSSMNQQARGTNMSKWVVTREALIDAVVGGNGSPGLGASLAVGLLFYPNRMVTVSTTAQDVTACVQTSEMVAPAALGPATGAQRTLLREALEQVQLQSSTPTHDAYRYAFEQGISQVQLPGKRFVVLITDGSPTLAQGCQNPSGQLSDVDPEPIVAEVQRVRDAGITTFLIGSPGSEGNRNWMSRAAQIGGSATPGCSPDGPTYCHMDMTTAPNFADALREGLETIAGVVTPCTYTFPSTATGTIDANKINVILSAGGQSQLVVRDDVGDCSTGWQLTAANEILLCKDTCAAAQSDPNLSVDVVFGCQSLQEPPK